MAGLSTAYTETFTSRDSDTPSFDLRTLLPDLNNDGKMQLIDPIYFWPLRLNPLRENGILGAVSDSEIATVVHACKQIVAVEPNLIAVYLDLQDATGPRDLANTFAILRTLPQQGEKLCICHNYERYLYPGRLAYDLTSISQFATDPQVALNVVNFGSARQHTVLEATMQVIAKIPLMPVINGRGECNRPNWVVTYSMANASLQFAEGVRKIITAANIDLQGQAA
jgi:hypothetical protein